MISLQVKEFFSNFGTVTLVPRKCRMFGPFPKGMTTDLGVRLACQAAKPTSDFEVPAASCRLADRRQLVLEDATVKMR